MSNLSPPNITFLDEFKRDFKKLKKKYKTLESDWGVFQKAFVAKYPGLLTETYRIPLGEEAGDDPVYKVRQFRCRCLGGGARSGIRVIYGHDSVRNVVTFIEIYHKSQQDNHNVERIQLYLRQIRDGEHSLK